MQDGYWPFHLFGAAFASEAEAHQFVFEQWEPEPPASATDAEYSVWEDRNPTWPLAQELGFYMDSDFVELNGSLADVITQIRSPAEQALVSANGAAFTHFILVGPDAIGGDRRLTATSDGPSRRLPGNTATLTYLGRFNQSA